MCDAFVELFSMLTFPATRFSFVDSAAKKCYSTCVWEADTAVAKGHYMVITVFEDSKRESAFIGQYSSWDPHQ